MGGQEIGDAAEGEGLPGHLARPRRPQGGGQGRAASPKELNGKAYDDPLVMKAYLNYCRRAIEFFKPDYLAIGIEVNEIHDLGPKTWHAYVALHKHVYAELKKDHPDLPIFASWTLHNMFKKRGAMLEDWKKLMPHNDLVAVSYYPFFVADKDRLAALDWMTDAVRRVQEAVRDGGDERRGRAAAAAEGEGRHRGHAGEAGGLLPPAAGAGPGARLRVRRQLRPPGLRRPVGARSRSIAPELFMAWRDCGLLDEKGKARPAYQVWKDYFDLPLQK